jgi:hypothetical protein
MEFGEALSCLVRAAFGEVRPSMGVPETGIVGTENRLGTNLPRILKEFYSIGGRAPEIMEANHHFVAIDQLQFRNDGLMFCQENQNQMFWGVLRKNTKLDDPPVVQGQPERDDWFDECPRLSTFLLNHSCWQLVNSMPAMGLAKYRWSLARKLRARMVLASAGVDYNMASFAWEGGRVLVCMLLDSQKVYVGAQSDAELEDFGRGLGVELDSL